MTKVKVCCISSVTEAELALSAGANVLGLVGPMPTGPGILTNEAIAAIVKAIPSEVHTWLLTSETSAEAIIAQHQQVKTTAIQLVTDIEAGGHAKIRAALPNVELVQVIHVLGEEAIASAKAIETEVDYVLLDSGNPAKAELGGTGRVHNWAVSKAIVESVKVPVFLAGGLRPDNVQAAIQQVRPFGLDLCSGIRTNKQLDAEKLTAFMSNVKAMGKEKI